MNTIYLKLLGLNILVTIMMFVMVDSLSKVTIYAIVGYVFITTPIYMVLNIMKAKKDMQE